MFSYNSANTSLLNNDFVNLHNRGRENSIKLNITYTFVKNQEAFTYLRDRIFKNIYLQLRHSFKRQ